MAASPLTAVGSSASSFIWPQRPGSFLAIFSKHQLLALRASMPTVTLSPPPPADPERTDERLFLRPSSSMMVAQGSMTTFPQRWWASTRLLTRLRCDRMKLVSTTKTHATADSILHDWSRP